MSAGLTDDEFYRAVEKGLEEFFRPQNEKILRELTNNFLAEVFRKIPGVMNVTEIGENFLIVTYILERIKYVEAVEQIWIVQFNNNSVAQLRTAIETYGASIGILLTTAERTQALETACNKLAADMNIPVYLIAGVEVAKFVQHYGLDLLVWKER
ncbi:MAG: hypothetical protein IJL14_07455 [Selenomonadaceae bacterium]|nr:hypothetical protein [Selenomonadaceae bacterium]MBQ6006068.1 hypothetical protein [Selenomonadaceae bacterium]